MAQEFFIKSADLEAKIRQLLPSQGGLGAGQDLSASTQIVPIVDLTESAEGSNLRQDLQTALGYSVTTFRVINSASNIITSTGYFRIFGFCNFTGSTSSGQTAFLAITDGAAAKNYFEIDAGVTTAATSHIPFDFVVFLRAGDTVIANSGASTISLIGTTRQIADIDGNLTNP